jgi:hypothetical protein
VIAVTEEIMTEKIGTEKIVAEEAVTSARTTGVQPQIAQSGQQPNTAQSSTGQSSVGQPSAPQAIERASLRKDRDDGITLLALYNFVLAGAFLLGTVFVALPTGITAIVGIVQDPGALIATLILGIIAFVLMTFCILFLIVAYGLWTMRQWARVAAIALAMLSLFAVPLGTIIGGVTIWYLIKPDVSEQFR